jgi:2-phosphosulfolactate phosphatase
MTIDVLLSPAEFEPLRQRNLSRTTCVVFDVLRATTSMMTALNHGAEAIIPVSEIPEALAIRDKDEKVLLAGERNGLRIGRELTGSVDFDFGNSPRDFTPERVEGRTIVWTTTNGTRALRSCAHAEMILLGSMLNLGAVTDILDQLRPQNLLIICSGTFEDVAYEDTFAAGALIDSLQGHVGSENLSDPGHIAHGVYLSSGKDPNRIRVAARNARKLLSIPELAPDVDVCLRHDTVRINAGLFQDGTVRSLRELGAKLA